MKDYQNYIFDFYGTLVDVSTDEESLSYWEEFAQLMGKAGAQFQPLDLKRRYLARIAAEEANLKEVSSTPFVEYQVETIIARLLREGGCRKKADELTLIAEEIAKKMRWISLDHIQPYQSTLNTLKTLREQGKKIFLLSNAQSLFTTEEIQMTGCQPYFDAIYLSSDFGMKKPSMDFFQMVLDLHQLDPEETVMVGNDATTDIPGASAVGLDSFLLNTFDYDHEDLAEFKLAFPRMRVINDLDELVG